MQVAFIYTILGIAACSAANSSAMSTDIVLKGAAVGVAMAFVHAIYYAVKDWWKGSHNA